MLRDTLGRRTSDNTEPFLMGVSGTNDEQESMPAEEHINDLNDDIFGSAPNSPVLSASEDQHERTSNGRSGGGDHSDIPRLRSLHITNGYREGIALSKESHIQAGFDEGFTLGGEIGQRVGYLLGVLEGISKAVKDDATRQVWDEAQEGLKIEMLLGEKWFGSDGVWLYHVDGEEDGDVTFEEVAKAHPVLSTWEKKVRELVEEIGLRLHGDSVEDEKRESPSTLS